MNKRTIIVLAGVLASLSLTLQAQDAGILDVITLKDGKGVLKGYINELIPGHNLTIMNREATLKIEQKQIAEVMKKSVIRGSETTEIDILTLVNGIQLEGTITERMPGVWTAIRTNTQTPLTYPYSEISKIGKETVNPEADIFKASGVLDVITLKNQSIVKGVIIEQVVGESGQ